MRKRIKNFLEILKFVQNYQRFLSKIAAILPVLMGKMKKRPNTRLFIRNEVFGRISIHSCCIRKIKELR